MTPTSGDEGRAAPSDHDSRKPPRLSLGDPLDERDGDDRPEAWGDRRESESDLSARYEAERPPHHGA